MIVGVVYCDCCDVVFECVVDDIVVECYLGCFYVGFYFWCGVGLLCMIVVCRLCGLSVCMMCRFFVFGVVVVLMFGEVSSGKLVVFCILLKFMFGCSECMWIVWLGLLKFIMYRLVMMLCRLMKVFILGSWCVGL